MTKIRTCKNRTCLYWQEQSCRLKELELDTRGICQDYICLGSNAEACEKMRQSITFDEDREKSFIISES